MNTNRAHPLLSTMRHLRTRGLKSFVTVLFLAGVQIGMSASNSRAAELNVHMQCPDGEPSCVMIDLNLLRHTDASQDVADHNLVVKDIPTDRDQYNITTLLLSGRLNGGEVEKHRVAIERFHGGMDCQDFSVPAIGFGAEKKGVVLTDKGALEIVDTGIHAGCKDCVAVLDQTNPAPISYIQTPTWEQTVDGHSVFIQTARCFGRHGRDASTLTPQILFKKSLMIVVCKPSCALLPLCGWRNSRRCSIQASLHG